MTFRFRLFGRPKRAAQRDAQKGVEWLIVGLGNPGRRYAGNRHNVGFHVVDRLAAANDWRFEERRYQAHLAYGHLERTMVALAKPQTYMNLSGKAVRRVAYFFKVPPARVLVTFDDLDLPLGSLRLRPKGGAGGHQGVASVIAHLQTRDFPRLRIGIGRPPGQMPPETYVLKDFQDDEKLIMEQIYQQAIESIHTVLRDGFDMAMNQFN